MDIKTSLIELVKLIRIKSSPRYIGLVNNPSERLQFAAVRSDTSALGLIKKPSMKVQEYVMKRNIRHLFCIDNISEQIQLKIIRENPNYIGLIKNPSKSVLKIIAKENPVLISGRTFDKKTAEELLQVNPNIRINIKNPTVKELYRQMNYSSKMFVADPLDDHQLTSLYDSFLKERNQDYNNMLSSYRHYLQEELETFTKNRVLPNSLQLSMISDRLGSYTLLEKPSTECTSLVLALATGNKKTDKAQLITLIQPLKNLVKEIEEAYIDSTKPLSSYNIGYLEDQVGNYDEQEVIQRILNRRLEISYLKFYKETGLTFNPTLHEGFNKKNLSDKYNITDFNDKNSIWSRTYDFQQKCNKAMSTINNNNNEALTKALESSNVKTMINDTEKMELLKKGSVTLSDGSMIKRIKTPVGYSFKIFNTAKNMTNQAQAEA